VFEVALKGVLARKGRVVTTAIAVLLGVAFVTGTLVLSDTIVKVFNDLFADVNEGTDAIVREESTFDDGFGTDIRGRIDAAALTPVLGAEGVADAEGGINTGFAQYVDQDGEKIGNPGQGAPTLGFSWPDIEELNPWVLTDGGPPVGPDQVVMDLATAEDNDFAVGDTVAVLSQDRREFTIAGIVRFGTADSPAGATVALFDLATAQDFLAEPGQFDSIGVVGEEGISQEQLAENIRRNLPADQNLEVLTGDELTEENQDDVEQQLSFFTTFLLVFAVIAVIVGGFVIYNTFGILVAQRGRELALLRAVGASRGQVIASVLAEATAVATLGSLAGLALGILLASGLRAAMNAFGVELPTNDLVLEPRTFVVGIVLGFLVTTVAAVFPAWRASRIPPVAAMRGVAVDESGHSRVRILAGLLITAIGALLLGFGLFGDSDNALELVGVGAGLVFLGVTVLGPVLVGPVTRVIAWPVARFRGMRGRLARENTIRNPKRTAATASALMIGVGLVGLITIVASSITLSIDEAIDDSFTGDFVLDSGSFGFGGLAPTLADELNQLPEVQTATGIRYGIARVRGFGEAMIALDPATAFDILEIEVLDGSPDDLDADGIALDDEKAADFGLQVGDQLPVEFAETGEQPLEVAMIFGESDLLQGTHYLLGRSAYEENFADQFDLQVYVVAAPDATLGQTRDAVEAVAEDYPNAEVQDVEEFKQAQADQINQFVSIVYVLLMLAVIIALFGIGNTLALSIIERTHELGLLRAVGMTRQQLRSTVRWESVLTSVFGTLLGLVIALFFGWAIVEALKDEGLNAFRIPVGSLVTIVVIAALAGVLAAVLPARRASKLNVLEAIGTE
jgi:putative ABC transport system permease protein